MKRTGTGKADVMLEMLQSELIYILHSLFFGKIDSNDS